MSTFLDKNKKKSALAALLLFIRTRKTAAALLLLVALASFLFVSPSNLLWRFPGAARVAAGAAWVAGKAGVDASRWGVAGGKRDYDDLLAAFQSAKESGGKSGWAAFMRGGEAADAARSAGGSRGSLGFVQGNAKDLETAGGSGADLPKPGSVEGVLNPDDAGNRAEGEGVALSEGDLAGEREGIVKSAFAGGFGKGAGFGGAAGSEGLLSGGAFASAGFFVGGKGAASGKLGDKVKNGLEGLISGRTGKGAPILGAAKGRISAARASEISARTNRGLAGSRTISGQRAFVQLAVQRGRSVISVAPHCTPGSGCPGEFAAVNTGAVYDGAAITGDRTDILTAPEIDGLSSPNLPDSGLADDYMRDAEKMEADAKKCRELDDLYGPQELVLDRRQEDLSGRFDAMGCGQGGCSKSKAKKCKRLGDQMKALCRENMTIRCRHVHECPLTAANNCSPAECDGPARNKSKVVDVNDGIRTTTMDRDEESAGCADSKRDADSARQSARNALDEYRGNGCESLYSSPLFTGKLKYLSTCSGRESSVVNTCKNYARSSCASARACSSTECTGDTDGCVITDLRGIEEFIQK